MIRQMNDLLEEMAMMKKTKCQSGNINASSFTIKLQNCSNQDNNNNM